MITKKFISAKTGIAAILLICLAAVLILPSCRKKQGEKAEYITLQFEKAWLTGVTGQFFEVRVDLNNRLFDRVKEIPPPSSYAESTYQSGILKDNVIGIIGTSAEPVRIIDNSPDGRWVSVEVNVEVEIWKKVVPRRTRFDVYLLDMNRREVCQKIELSNSMYFTDDSNSCIFDNVFNIEKMSLPSFERTRLCKAGELLMLPDRKKLLVFQDKKILLTDIEGNMESTIGKYFPYAKSAGLINNEWAYLITQVEPKNARSRLYFINLNNYEVIAYPHRFNFAKLIRVKGPDPNSN